LRPRPRLLHAPVRDRSCAGNGLFEAATIHRVLEVLDGKRRRDVAAVAPELPLELDDPPLQLARNLEHARGVAPTVFQKHDGSQATAVVVCIADLEVAHKRHIKSGEKATPVGPLFAIEDDATGEVRGK